MAKDQSFLSVDPILLDLMAPTIVNVVVADDDVEPSLLIESVQQIKGASVGVENVAEFTILPHLIPIAHLDVGESFPMIVGQRLEEQVLITRKGICPAVVSPVQVAEKNQPGGVVEGELLGRLEYLCQSSVRANPHTFAISP
jgi:hypothetical protein